MKVLLTGTHFTTAVATIEEFRAYPKVELVYIGRKTTREGDSTLSQESIELPKMGVKFIPIIAGRLQRSFSIYTFSSLLKIPVGFLQGFWIVWKERPDVILSFGGYLAVPVVFASWLLSIPIIIHEQTLVTGLANKISSFFAEKIAISFESDYSFDKDKIVLTGNPLRREILESKSARGSKNLPTVLITGGNQGSHVINKAVEECLGKLIRLANVIHQTGDSKFGDFERLVSRQNDNYKVAKWIDMGKVLREADLVVGRAGINTLTETAFLGIPTLVIPIAYLYKDEQNVNARYFEKLGLVKILPQSKLSGNSLLLNIKKMLENLETLKNEAHGLISKNAKSVIIPDAAKKLALETIILSKS